MCVYMCVCVSRCAYVCICVCCCVYRCVCVLTCVYVCISVCMCAYVCIWAHTCQYVRVCVHTCAYVYICVPICLLQCLLHQFYIVCYFCVSVKENVPELRNSNNQSCTNPDFQILNLCQFFMGGCVSLVIYLIVYSCCLGPEASSQLNHLKFRASKPSHHFIECLFWVSPRQG